MIDTDKYEGHTEGEWLVVEAGISRVMVYTNDKDFSMASANRNLIADAPLLLEEVKQLQKYSNVLEKLMGSLDSRDEGDWILLEYIDELMKEEGIARWSEEKDKTETNLI